MSECCVSRTFSEDRKSGEMTRLFRLSSHSANAGRLDSRAMAEDFHRDTV